MKIKYKKLFVKHLHSIDRWRFLAIIAAMIFVNVVPFCVVCIAFPVLYTTFRHNNRLQSGFLDGVLLTMTAQICESMLREVIKATALVLLAVTVDYMARQMWYTNKPSNRKRARQKGRK